MSLHLWKQHSTQHVVNSRFAFGNFLGFYFILFFNIFDLPLVESLDAKPVEMDGRL